MIKFIKLEKQDGTWDKFTENWQKQCLSYGEDFNEYYYIPISTVKDLIEKPIKVAAVYALQEGDDFHAMCQVNVTDLPGYIGKVLRVRMLYLSPNYDLGINTADAYAKIITLMFHNVLGLSHSEMKSKHIKFHLRSPTDQMFFHSFANHIDKENLFESIDMRGPWLYITKN